RQLTLENIAFRQTEVTFQIERRYHLSMKNDVLNVGRMLSDGVDDRIAKLFTLFVPRALLQIVWRVLHEAGHDVLARRGDRRIGQGRNHYVDVRPPRKASVLSLVVSAFHVIDAR